jgi:hypothetical protein
MSWELYYSEISKAKDEYDRAVRPLMEVLENVHREAWERYVIRLKQAETLLKEDTQ